MGKARVCARCKGALPPPAGNGRPRVYCRVACRKAAYRRRVARPGKATRSDWHTPLDVAQGVLGRWVVGLDAAACEVSTLVPGNWLGPTHPDRDRRDALLFADWAGLVPVGEVVWLNPPYEPRVLTQFLARAHATAVAGRSVVALIPAATGTNWWHARVTGVGAQVEFLRGRLSFGGPHASGGPAPWSSALVVFPAGG